MGIIYSSIAKLWLPKDARVLVLGLDNAGKTTVLYRLHAGECVSTLPTIGFNVENFQYGGVNICCWDVGGQDRIRPLWRHYLEGTHALIFVVDSADPSRFAEAQEELYKLLQAPELRRASVLVFANKQDLPNAVPIAQISQELGLNSETQHRWFIQGCSAKRDEGLYEGLGWLTTEIKGMKE